jgi:4-amino-4-deoxy-L-arabinose transferase-like glycosyltransferase
LFPRRFGNWLRSIASRFEWLALALVFGAGLFLRWYRLTLVPRGVLYDEAFNGLDVIQILRGARPIFLPANYGREALFIYLQAISVASFGYVDWALRVPSAIVGSLTLATSYLLVRRLYGPRVALLTGGWLAVSLWHVMYSRIGLRTIMVPLVVSIAFYCAWRGLAALGAKQLEGPAPLTRRQRWGGLTWFAASGVALGVAQYTYPTAHFAPFVLVGLAGTLMVADFSLFRRALLGFVIAGVVAILVFAPEAQYFLDHPTAFATRPSEVSVFNSKLNNGDLATALAYTTSRSLGMFFIRGDEEWDRNISNRPIFDPLSSVIAVVGLVVLARRLREPRYAFTIIWLVVMLLPSMITSGNVPVFLRVTGLIPAVFVVPALGADWLLGWLVKRAPSGWRVAPLAAASALFFGGAALTYRDYFDTWARAPQVSVNFNEDRWLAIELGRRLAPTTAHPVYVGAGDVDEPLQVFAFGGAGPPRDLAIFNGQTSLMLPPKGTPATYLFATRDLPPEPVRQRFFANPSGIVVDRTLSGDPITRFELGGAIPEAQPTDPLPARLGNDFGVAGFDVQRDANSGEELTVRAYWSVLATEAREVYFFYQLLDDAGNRVSQIDQRALSPGYWPPGTRGVTTVRLPIDPKLATGAYSLVAGAYFRQDLTRLPVIDGLGRVAGSQLELGLVKVRGHATPWALLPTGQGSPTTFGDSITLLGADVQPAVVRLGGNVKVTLYWAARGRPSANYTVYVHLLDAQGHAVGNADALPRAGRYPTTVWDAGEIIADEHDLTINPSVPPGSNSIEVGMYLPATGARLPTVDGGGSPRGDHVVVPGPRVVGN